jgi:hypothetical protein
MNWLKEKKIKILLYACILSLAGLVILFGIRAYAPTLLDIDIKWLVVAAIPIILALIVGRFITRFKWMGIDIELAAGGRIIDHEEVFQIIAPFTAQSKDDLDVLRSMSQEQKQRPNVLAFKLGNANYYQEGAVVEYIKELRNVQFFMIIDKAGKFVAMIYFYRALFERQNYDHVNRFILELQEEKIPSGFGIIITGRVSANSMIIDAYKRLRREYPGVLLVFSDHNPELPAGFITIELAERYLANLVVKIVDRKQSGDKG